MSAELNSLRRRNRQLERENRELRKMLKCDVKEMRQEALKEGWQTGFMQGQEVEKKKKVSESTYIATAPP